MKKRKTKGFITALFLPLLLVSVIAMADSAKIPELQVAEAQQVIGAGQNPHWICVDTRLNDAFNGWVLTDKIAANKGGHIPGAVDFSANWLKVKSDTLAEELQQAIKDKGMTKDKKIILYDTNNRDALEVADYLLKHGFNKENLFYYNLISWQKDSIQPLEKYSHYHLIVPAFIVKNLLDGKPQPTFDKDKKVKIFECSWGEEKTSYAKGHIPTAVHINSDRIEPPTKKDPVMWMLADDATLKKVAEEFGIASDDIVIVASEEPLAAFRLATILRYLGVSDVRVLNGGTLAWTMAGYRLETRSNSPQIVKDFGKNAPARPDIIDTIEEVEKGLERPENFTLVDNRTWEEHIGESSGYSYHDKKGRVPGSVFGYAGKKDAYSMEYYRNPDKTMRNGNEILALWKKEGIDINKHLSFMCGSGWRVAEVYTYADIMGLSDIAIFSDGWIGWSNAGKPIISGRPK